MRKLLLAFLAALTLSSCSSVGFMESLVNIESLPTYPESEESKLYLLIPNLTCETADQYQCAATHFRNAGMLVLYATHQTFEMPDGWTVTQEGSGEDGAKTLIHITQSSSGRTDSIETFPWRVTDDPLTGWTVAKLAGWKSYLKGVYVLNSRFFVFELGDKRIVFFDRQAGKFLHQEVRLKTYSGESLIYVDKEGRPYARELEDYYKRGPLKKLELEGISLSAPLSPQ